VLGPLDRSVWSDPKVLEWVSSGFAEHDGLMVQLEAALARPICRLPVPDALGSALETLPYHRAADCLTFRANLGRARGDIEGAARDWLLLLRLGDALGSEPHSILQARLACTFIAEAWAGLEALSYDGSPPSSIVSALLLRPALSERDPDPIRKALEHNDRLSKDSLLLMLRDEMGEEHSFPFLTRLLSRENSSLHTLAQSHRSVLELRQRLPADRDAHPAPSTAAMFRSLLRGDAAARILAQLEVAAIIDSLNYFDRTLLVERSVRTVWALRGHEVREGRLPASLAELVAGTEELHAEPIDPYSGAPLRYDPARRILWSVGEDGIDGGGDGWEELRDDPEAERFALPDWVWPIAPVPGG
jgi:hypothetical protein